MLNKTQEKLGLLGSATFSRELFISPMGVFIPTWSPSSRLKARREYVAPSTQFVSNLVYRVYFCSFLTAPSIPILWACFVFTFPPFYDEVRLGCECSNSVVGDLYSLKIFRCKYSGLFSMSAPHLPFTFDELFEAQRYTPFS